MFNKIKSYLVPCVGFVATLLVPVIWSWVDAWSVTLEASDYSSILSTTWNGMKSWLIFILWIFAVMVIIQVFKMLKNKLMWTAKSIR